MISIVAILVLTVGGSVLLALRTGDALELANRTRATRGALSAALEAVQDAETGQRGFLLTGKPEYLVPYESAVTVLPYLLERLRKSVAERPERAAVIAEVRALTTAKLDEMSRTVALTRSGDRDGAMALIQTDAGNRDMQHLRAIVAGLLDSERAIIDRETDRIGVDRNLLILFDVLGLGLIIVLVVSGAVAARRALRFLQVAGEGLRAANAELAAVNDNLEERVRQRTADLTEASDEIQRFAYIVSHDLRAPLVNIMGFTSELDTVGKALDRFLEIAAPHVPSPVLAEARAALGEDLPEALRFIKTSASKMDRLIGAILQLSREGRRVIRPERVDMGALVGGIVESMAVQIAGAAIDVQALPDVVSDRLALEQVFSNVVENAVKYLKPGRPGRIVVRGHVAGGEAVFEIEDNGRGIAPRDHERVFELFRRAGDQTIAGEGIGLANVRALVRRLGGTIDCLSALNVGSTFRIQIPIVLAQAGVSP